MQDVLTPQEEALNFADDYIEARAGALRRRFDEVDAGIAPRNNWAAALAKLPEDRRAGWLTGVQAAVSVSISAARRGSALLRDAALDMLPAAANRWDLAPAFSGAVRGAAARQLEATGPAGRLSITTDDAGAIRRILVTIAAFPAAAPVPVVLVVATGTAEPQEFNPEVEADAAGTQTLRYLVTLPPGPYQLFIGNPRSPEADDEHG